MKKHTLKIIITVFFILSLSTVFLPNIARAETVVGSLLCIFKPEICSVGSFIASNFIMGIIADLGNAILQISAWFLGIAGVILNISIILTMNIRAIYEATPAIEQIWIVIRNMSSIFIIFILLYTSIMTILDIAKTSIKDLIIKIILAGLLINFSLLFTKVAIDASNLVSLQLYRAIVPNSSQTKTLLDSGDISGVLKSSFDSGGIADVFMSNLKITKIYDKKTNKSVLTDSNGGKEFKIVVAAIAGSALMIIAAISFIAVSVMFIVRLVVLLLLLGFSPVYAAGMIFPKIEQKVSKGWMKWLERELLFMPVYLLFMYVCLRFISSIGQSGATEGFFAALEYSNSNTTSNNGIFLSSVGIIMQYAIALTMINIPMIAALQIGGMGAGWAENTKNWLSNKLSASNLWSNTGGRVASRMAKSETLKNFAASSVVGEYAYKGIKGAAKNYNEKLSARVKARTDFAESLGEDSRLSIIKAQLSDQRAQLKRAKDMKSEETIKAINSEIAKLEEQKNSLDDKRKEAYAKRISSRTAGVFGSSGTLWTMIAKEDKTAAKEIQNKIKRGEVESLKKKIEDEKPDLKRLENKLRAASKDDGEKLSTDEEEYLNKLRENLAANQSKISRLEIEINS